MYYSEAIRLNPQYAAAYYNRGKAYKVRGNYVRAMSDYGEAIRLNPQDADAYYSRAAICEAQGDLFGALGDYLNQAT